MDGQLISIEEFIQILKERWKVIAISIFIFLLLAIILSFFIIKPKYEVTTKFFIGKESIGEEQNYSQNDVIMYQNLMKTYSEIIKTPDILLSSIEKTNIDANLEDISNKLTVTAIADTQILEVNYRSTDSNEAKDFINNITNEFVKVSEDLVPNGSVKVLQKAILSEEAVSPNKKINTLIGLFAGLIIGIILALVMEFFDKTIRSKECLEKEIDIPVIGQVPLIDNKK